MDIREMLAYCKFDGENEYGKFVDECIITDFFDLKDNQDDDFVSKSTPFGKACYAAILKNKRFFKAGTTLYEILDSILYNDDLDDIPKDFEEDWTSEQCDVTVIVYYGMMRCQKQKHNIESVTAKVTDILTSNVCRMNVQHCIDCNIYFIHSSSLRIYHNQGISPNIRFYGGIHPFDIYQGRRLKEQSILNQYGYNLQRSQIYRHKIIQNTIDHDYMKKYEIIQHLEFLLWIHKNNPKQQNSLIEWRRDLNFVNEYDIHNQKQVSGNLEYRK